MARSANSPTASPARRLRWGALPAPAPKAELGWGKRQEHLRDLSNADLVQLILSAPEFEEVLGERLDAIDARQSGRRGHPVRWTARQLESVLIYRRVAGLGTVKRTRERLTFDRKGRLQLGFGEELPSEATVSRYINKHFPESDRAQLYRELERRLRLRVAELPDFDEEAKVLGMDGSKVEIRYTPPIPETDERGKATGRITNPDRITAPEAGYIGKEAGDHAGKGYQLVAIVTEHGTPVAWDISALHHSEYPAAERVIADYKQSILPKRSEDRLSVLTADGGFSSNTVRRLLQESRIVPNIHRASHGDGAASVKNAAKLNRQRIPFHDPLKPHYANWSANGHGELFCSCGQGRTERITQVENGSLRIATLGRCATCGTVRINAGSWRRVQNAPRVGQSRFVRCMPGEEGERYLGNPLTFNDPYAREYGQDRFGWGESFHATMSRRFGLLRGKCWMRRKAQVETEFSMAFSAIHSLVLEKHRRQTTAPPTSAPPPALAA